jgi:POT family proton-dependent oligopeptide transporter
MPAGLPYIIGNEAAERFSFYGMRTILVTFMTKYLVDSSGTLDLMDEDQAKGYYHLFMMAAYFFPILGAIAADLWLGKYRTIVSLSIVYCLGHLALALDDTRLGLFLGLTLVAIGTGGIKPCVSAHLGDQFGKSNASLQSAAFGWFYLSINFGSFISTALTPWLLERFPGWLRDNFYASVSPPPAFLERIGPHVAFGVPGILMFIATIVFWLGRHKFVHIPARGWEAGRCFDYCRSMSSSPCSGRSMTKEAAPGCFRPARWIGSCSATSCWSRRSRLSIRC